LDKLINLNRRYRLNTLLSAGFFTLILLAVIVGLISINQINKSAKPILEDIPQNLISLEKSSLLDNSAQLIRYYDEVLTMSARNYAFTSDVKWKKRYQEIEPELDKIINLAIKNGDEVEKLFFSEVNNANLALVSLEEKSLKLVDQGESRLAIDLLESQEYWDFKEVYNIGLSNYVDRRESIYSETLLVSFDTIELSLLYTKNIIKRTKFIIISIILIAIIISLFLTFLLGTKISKGLSKLSSQVDEISRGNFMIEIEPSNIYEINTLSESFDRILKTMKLAILNKKEKSYRKKVLPTHIKSNDIFTKNKDSYERKI
jgi:methyl-accepting chemotaxis protein